jgi:hypothetical protein
MQIRTRKLRPSVEMAMSFRATTAKLVQRPPGSRVVINNDRASLSSTALSLAAPPIRATQDADGATVLACLIRSLKRSLASRTRACEKGPRSNKLATSSDGFCVLQPRDSLHTEYSMSSYHVQDASWRQRGT